MKKKTRNWNLLDSRALYRYIAKILFPLQEM